MRLKFNLRWAGILTLGLALVVHPARAGSEYVTTQQNGSSGATQNWDDSATWTPSGFPNGPYDTANLQPIANSSTINVDGIFAVTSITIAANDSSTPGSWTLSSDPNAALLAVGGINNNSTAPATIAANIVIGSTVSSITNLDCDLVAGSTTLITGSLSDAVNVSATVTMSNAGTLELDGTNIYSGGTFLNNGTLIAGNAVSPFGTGTLNVAGGTLMLGNGVHTINVTNYNQTAGTLILSVAGTGQAAIADKLQIANGTPATLGGALTVNLTGYLHTGGTTNFTLVSTLDGYSGSFTTDFVGLASGLTATLDYTLDDVLLNIEGSTSFSLTGLNANQRAPLGSINHALLAGNVSAPFTALTTALMPLSTNPSLFGPALDQLSPEEFGRFTSVTAFNNASFETQAADSYLESRRDANGTFLAGNGKIDTSGMTVNDPSYDPALSMVHSRMLAWSPGALPGGMISDVADAVLGGVDMKDPKDMKDTKSMTGLEYTDPWNFFVRGNVILAQGFSQADVAHFDDNTESVVVGTDYRINPNLLVGLTAGYAHTDVTLDGNGSSATVDSYSPGLYASYANQGWYTNLTGSYNHNAYTQARAIAFLGQTANSAPEGNEGVANLDGGYDFHHGALTFGPLAGIQYTHLTVDGYSESGSIADLNVNDQQDDSLRSRLGGRVSFAFSHYGVTFRPHLDATWQHEFMDQSRGITSQFNGFGGGSFSVRTETPRRDFALADAGFDADLNRTITVFTDYTVQAGQDNYFGQSVQAGMKIGF